MYHVAMVLQIILRWEILTQPLTKKGKKKDVQPFYS